MLIKVTSHASFTVVASIGSHARPAFVSLRPGAENRCQRSTPLAALVAIAASGATLSPRCAAASEIALAASTGGCATSAMRSAGCIPDAATGSFIKWLPSVTSSPFCVRFAFRIAW